MWQKVIALNIERANKNRKEKHYDPNGKIDQRQAQQLMKEKICVCMYVYMHMYNINILDCREIKALASIS